MLLDLLINSYQNEPFGRVDWIACYDSGIRETFDLQENGGREY
jgi:hypothetical protein